MSAKSASKTAFYHFNPSCSVLETNSKRVGDVPMALGSGKELANCRSVGMVRCLPLEQALSLSRKAQPSLSSVRWSGVCAGRGITSWFSHLSAQRFNKGTVIEVL